MGLNFPPLLQQVRLWNFSVAARRRPFRPVVPEAVILHHVRHVPLPHLAVPLSRFAVRGSFALKPLDTEGSEGGSCAHSSGGPFARNLGPVRSRSAPCRAREAALGVCGRHPALKDVTYLFHPFSAAGGIFEAMKRSGE